MKTLTIGGNTYEIVDDSARKTLAELHTSVKKYGAKGDGSTDDTAAFKAALEANRVVFVPGGTYKLSGTLVIRENCCLELSQDTILQFTQTSGNCIEMRGSAVLRGNHAMVSVPYAFAGNVISMDTSQDGTKHNNIPPYLHSGSHMFKRQRFVYDINILKPDANGICKSTDGKCNGTAIYMHCLGTASIRWMWAITMSGVRIAGGFSYGIRAKNIDDPNGSADNAWNHDMRIEAVIENCEVGVALENCNGAHLAVTIQPHATDSGVKYAKHGVYLNDARYIDMIGSRVWDWNESNTLWTSGGQYQHIALVGNCRGLLLDDFLCNESAIDIRDLIYTDTPSNFDTMSILQEPGSKWFKSVECEPYFNDGNGDKRLAMKSDIDEYFKTDRIAQFTDVLATSIDKDGNVYGTASGYYDSKFETLTASAYHIHTGFIPCKKGDTFITDGIGIRDEGNVRVTFFDSDFNYIVNASGKNMLIGTYHVEPCVITSSGFRLTIKNLNDANINKIAYARFNFHAYDVGERPVMTINEEIQYTQAGFLADGIKVKGENVVGGASGGVTSWNELTDRPEGVGKKTIVELIPETKVTVDEDGLADFTYDRILEANTKYRFVLNGVEYIRTSTIVDGAVALGNVLGETDEPFGIFSYYMDEEETMPAMMLSILDGSTSATFSLEEIVYETIPAEYMPKHLQQYSVEIVHTDFEVDVDNLVQLSADATRAAEVYWNGGSVFVDLTMETEYGKYVTTRLNVITMTPAPTNEPGVSQIIGTVIYGNVGVRMVNFGTTTWLPPLI